MKKTFFISAINLLFAVILKTNYKIFEEEE